MYDNLVMANLNTIRGDFYNADFEEQYTMRGDTTNIQSFKIICVLGIPITFILTKDYTLYIYANNNEIAKITEYAYDDEVTYFIPLGDDSNKSKWYLFISSDYDIEVSMCKPNTIGEKTYNTIIKKGANYTAFPTSELDFDEELTNDSFILGIS